MRNVKKIYHIEKALHMINLEQNVLCGEMWRNLSCGEMFPHDRLLHMNKLTFFSCKICFVTIYAVLSQNLFCRDLRAFVWRKVEPKIVLVEKKDKYQVYLRFELSLTNNTHRNLCDNTFMSLC